MVTKMLFEIFQAIAEELGFANKLNGLDASKFKNIDMEAFMDELELSEEQRKKFRATYMNYQNNQGEKYQYKYEPKSNSPFDKFDAYWQKFEEKHDMSDAKWQQYKQQRQQYEKQYKNAGKNNSYSKNKSNFNSFKQNQQGSLELKYYQALEIHVGASFEEIKLAYKKAMKKYHPDRFTDESQKKHAGELSRKINEAYAYFKKKYDKN